MHLLLASVRAMLTDSDCVCVRVTSLTMCVVAAFALRLVNDISVLTPQAGPGPGPPPRPLCARLVSCSPDLFLFGD